MFATSTKLAALSFAAAPDKGKDELKDLAATQLEFPLGCPSPMSPATDRQPDPENLA